MATASLFLATLIALQTQSPTAGSIQGVVSNASRDSTPVGGAEVVLRVMIDGQFVIAAEGVADPRGRFVFDNIPADSEYVYLPGANRAGVHYPGPRVVLNRATPHVRVNLPVHDVAHEPNPLVIRRHDILIRPETDALRVTETLQIENPILKTYVGRPVEQGDRATTLQLSIPSDFRRTTFEQEFYGRQFILMDGALVTDIPWPPGTRDLAFTYTVPNRERRRVWSRPLDLPCDHLRISVLTDNPQQVSCNLPPALAQTPGRITFESQGEVLPDSQVIRVQMGLLPVSMATYARWLAACCLLIMILSAIVIGIWSVRRRQTKLVCEQATHVSKRAA